MSRAADTWEARRARNVVTRLTFAMDEEKRAHRHMVIGIALAALVGVALGLL